MEKRFCFRCKTEVKTESESAIGAPYYCPQCDENMYTFETFTSARKVYFIMEKRR